MVPFCGMDHQKSNFSLILALFLSEAVEASRCYFFENWWIKLKCSLLLKPLATKVQENSQSWLLEMEKLKIEETKVTIIVSVLKIVYWEQFLGL